MWTFLFAFIALILAIINYFNSKAMKNLSRVDKEAQYALSKRLDRTYKDLKNSLTELRIDYLKETKKLKAKNPYKITDSCIACGSCLTVCPVNCIKEGEMFEIDQKTCIGCGRCENVCPTSACEKIIWEDTNLLSSKKEETLEIEKSNLNNGCCCSSNKIEVNDIPENIKDEPKVETEILNLEEDKVAEEKKTEIKSELEISINKEENIIVEEEPKKEVEEVFIKSNQVEKDQLEDEKDNKKIQSDKDKPSKKEIKKTEKDKKGKKISK